MTKILETSQRCVEGLRASGGRNTFGPGLPFINWTEDGEAYEAHTRCSSFVTLVIRRAHALPAQTMRRWFGRSSPYAADYHEAILRGDLHERFSLKLVDPGDLFSVDYEGGFNDLGFTGHSALIASKPVETREFLGQWKVWTVDVIDSSLSSHGPGDTRFVPGTNGAADRELGGVGRGTMRLLGDASSGLLVGYTWSVRESSPAMVNGKGQTARIAALPENW